MSQIATKDRSTIVRMQGPQIMRWTVPQRDRYFEIIAASSRFPARSQREEPCMKSERRSFPRSAQTFQRRVLGNGDRTLVESKCPACGQIVDTMMIWSIMSGRWDSGCDTKDVRKPSQRGAHRWKRERANPVISGVPEPLPMTKVISSFLCSVMEFRMGRNVMKPILTALSSGLTAGSRCGVRRTHPRPEKE
jgi:hypothetical protein